MVVILVGVVNVIFDRAVHPAKALAFTLCMDALRISEPKPVHPPNALTSMSVRLALSVSDVSPVQLENAFELIAVTPTGIVNAAGNTPVYPVITLLALTRVYSVLPNMDVSDAIVWKPAGRFET